MKKLLLILLLFLTVSACTKKPETVSPDPPPTPTPEVTPTATTQSGGTVKPTASPTQKPKEPFVNEAITQAREFMAPAKLGIIYAGTLYGTQAEINEKFDLITQRYPFIMNMEDDQLIYGNIKEDSLIMVLILIPEENATLSIDDLKTGAVLYRDEYGTPVVFMDTLEPGNPTVEVTVVAEKTEPASIRPALGLIDGRLRENMNMLILDLSDYDWLTENTDVPFYQQSCFDRIMYRDDVYSQIEKGKQIKALWDSYIDGQYYLCFGLGDDPTQSDKIDAYYCSRPDSDAVYYSEDLMSWTLLK